MCVKRNEGTRTPALFLRPAYSLDDMRIVITGATGFIGQAVADIYLKAGHHVFVTGHEAPVPGAEYLGRDFQAIDFDKLPAIDILNHQAAVTDPQHADPPGMENP
jgi:nucleoside-diphosphate-sugar epimerase